MARLEIRIPEWLKRQAQKRYANLSLKIRELLIKDLGPTPIKKLLSIKRVDNRGDKRHDN